MKPTSKKNDFKPILAQSNRNQLELFLVYIMHHKLEKFTKKSYNTKELRQMMSELPHFDPDTQFMMLKTYEQGQIFKAYKQVFLSSVSDFSRNTTAQFIQLIDAYLNCCSEEDCLLYTNFLNKKDLAA